MALTTSPAGRAALARREGNKLTAYRDSVGVWTIGVGHTSAAGPPQVTPGLKITAAQSDEILSRDLATFEASVRRAIKRPMTQNQFDAMVSLAFNIGGGAFGRSSIVRRFNAGDVTGAAEAFLLYVKAGGKTLKGLVTRRKDEANQFLRPDRAAAAPAKPKAPPAPAPAPAPDLVTPTAPPPTGILGRLRVIFGRPTVPAIKATKGDPVVYGVQEQLKAKGYYQTGLLDGIDGRKTRDAVSSIRKDNGMGDGGMDAEFMRRLPGFPQAPVSPERAAAGPAQAAAARPEVFEAPRSLTIGGLTIGGLSGLLGFGGDTLKSAKEAADKAGDAIDTVQAIISPILTVVTWCLAHPWLVIGGCAVWMLMRGLLPWATLLIQWRQGRL